MGEGRREKGKKGEEYIYIVYIDIYIYMYNYLNK